MKNSIFMVSLSALMLAGTTFTQHKDLQNNVDGKTNSCCEKLRHELCKLKPCGDQHVIDKVPAVIDKPGKWCVKRNLEFTGTGNAITIAANNVTLNFGDHNLLIPSVGAVGIFADGVSELVILNDKISCPTVSTDPTVLAIHLLNCDKVTVDNVFTQNTFQGIFVENSTDVFITRSRFKDHVGGLGTNDTNSNGLKASGSTAVVIEESTFTGGGANPGLANETNGAQFNNGCTNCHVSNCQFAPVDTGIFAQQIDGLIVENSTFESTLETGFSLMYTGGESTLGNDVMIRNCTFNSNGNVVGGGGIYLQSGANYIIEDVRINSNGSAGDGIAIGIPAGGGLPSAGVDGIIIKNTLISNVNALLGFEGIVLLKADGVLIDNVIIDTNTAFFQAFNYHSAAIHIGYADSASDLTSVVTGLTIRNSVITNTPDIGIRSESGSSNIVVDNCNIAGGVTANIFFDDTSNSVIKNNEITTSSGDIAMGAGNGLVLNTIATGSNNNSVIDNVITNNSGTGLLIASGSTLNIVQNNIVSNNGGYGINNVVPTANTQIYFNTACNNGAGDCVGIPPALVTTPGSPTSNAGTNICCSGGAK